MAHKKLIETLEIRLIVPEQSGDIALEHMFSEWGSVPMGHLSVLLVHLRFLAMLHQTHHWQAKGDTFYGDHLLFERLYNAVVPEIDVIAEKAVGLGSVDSVNLPLQVSQLNRLIRNYGMSSTIPRPNEFIRRSMIGEVGLLRCADAVITSLKATGMLSRGVDNAIAGIEDSHESALYLLKQRCSCSEI